MAQIHQAQENGNKIILAAVAIEQQLETVILMKIAPTDEPSLSFFTDYILSSESVGLSFKRKLVLNIINQHSLLSGAEKEHFEKILRNVITWRNAFAHGEVAQKGLDTYITYSQDGPREILLSDDYWTSVESTFQDAYAMITLISMRLDAVSKDISKSESQWSSQQR